MRKKTIASRCWRLVSRYCRIAGVADGGDAGGGESGVTPEYNIAPMRILALDTSARRGSVAWLTPDGCDARTGDANRTHTQRLPGELLALLHDHGASLRDVDLFAVISGPGSFTGLRVGIAAIQGLSLVGGQKVVAVPTLDAIAEGFRIEWAAGGRPQAAGHPLVISVLDGQRNDIFYAAWRLDRDRPIEEADTIIE